MRLINSNRYYLPNTQQEYLHLATMTHNLREYICFANVKTSQIYIEEITGGQLAFVADDSLAEALHQYLIEHQVLVMNRPLIPDSDWYTLGKDEKSTI